MFRRADDPEGSSRPGGSTAGAARPPVHRSGGSAMDALLATGPGFPTAMRGYDRLHVDNYVAEAEAELLARGGRPRTCSPATGAARRSWRSPGGCSRSPRRGRT